MGTIKEFKYKIIKNLLNDSEVKLLSHYVKLKHQFNKTFFSEVHLQSQGTNEDTGYYSDFLMESLLVEKLPIFEKEIDMELFPTYSYWRMYTMFSALHAHVDRPACEVSVTVSLANCGTKWPIFMDGVSVLLEPGDAAIYSGMEVTHHREEFTGDYNAQVFLHYVNKNGKYSAEKYDKRLGIGVNSDGNS